MTTAPKSASGEPAVSVDDDPVARSIDNAPIDATALSAEELAALEARLAHPVGTTRSTSDVLAAIAERARREE